MLWEWPPTLLPLIDVLHEHSSLQQVARAVLLAEDDDEGGLLGLTRATCRRELRLQALAPRPWPGANAGTLRAAVSGAGPAMAQKGWGRSEGLSAGELTGMYCTAAWPVPLSSHWPSSLRQYTFARWRASTPLSPMLAHPAQGPGARAAAAVSHRRARRQLAFAVGLLFATRWRLDGGAKTDRPMRLRAAPTPCRTLAINSFSDFGFRASPRLNNSTWT